jgi:hypothetical protein
MLPLSSLAMRSTLKRSIFSPTRNSGLVASALPLARLSFLNRTTRSKSISRKFRNIQEYHQNHRWILFVEVMGIVGVIASASTLILGFVQERGRYTRQRKEEDDLSNRAERDVAVGETWIPKGIGLVQKGSARAAQFFTWGGLKEKSGEEKGSRERREKDEQVGSARGQKGGETVGKGNH